MFRAVAEASAVPTPARVVFRSQRYAFVARAHDALICVATGAHTKNTANTVTTFHARASLQPPLPPLPKHKYLYLISKFSLSPPPPFMAVCFAAVMRHESFGVYMWFCREGGAFCVYAHVCACVWGVLLIKLSEKVLVESPRSSKSAPHEQFPRRVFPPRMRALLAAK